MNQYFTDKLLTLQKTITKYITNQFKIHESTISTQMLNFRNEQIKNRIARKFGKIPKINNTIHKLLDTNDIGNDVDNLNDIVILNVYIKRLNWYFDSRSAHAEDSFKDTFELMFNKEMTTYNCFFKTFDNFWDLGYILEYIKIPKPESNENVPIRIISNE